MMRSMWRKSLFGAIVLHVLLTALLALLGVNFVKAPEEHTPETIRVGFVDLTVADASSAVGADAAGHRSPDEAVLRAAMRTAGPPIRSAVVRPAPQSELLGTLSDTAEDVTASAPAVMSGEMESAASSAAMHAGDTNASGTGNGGADNGAGHGNGAGDGLGDGFQSNGDGTYTALSSAGIAYTILRDAQAVYPDEARAIGFSRTVGVEARILVGLDGSVESVRILSDTPKLGFREAAADALRQMRFAPIYYQGRNIKMYFLKTIYFQP